MKKMRRFAALAAAAAMTACMAVPMMAVMPASATDGNNIISINMYNPDDAGLTHSSFAAYQIFAGTWNEDTETPANSNLTVSGWGDGVKIDDFLAAIKADATIGKYFAKVEQDDGNGGTTEVDIYTNNVNGAVEVAKVVAGWGDDSAEAKAFARLAVANKDAASGSYDNGAISGIADGYYVISDTTAASNGTDSAWSLGMLEVAGGTDVSVTTKIDYPEVVKKVQEDDVSTDQTYGAGYNDVADWDANTPVPFKIIANAPSNIDDYNHYWMQFTDTLADNFDTPTGIVVTVDGHTLTETTDYKVSFAEGSNDMVLEIMDLQNIVTDATAGTKLDVDDETVVTITYTAKLNSTGDTLAEIGLSGQENEVYLEYSNNPNVTGDGTGTPGDGNTGKTEEDTVIVFTYELDITKIDGATQDELEGAQFLLANGNTDTAKYAKVDTTTNYFLGWVDKAEATTLTSDANGLFKVIGLDDGTYYLYEQKWSEEYNIPTTPFEVEIDADTLFNQTYKEATDTDEATEMLTALTGTVDGATATTNLNDGTVAGKIANNMGTQLPSTGGIGTTIFYVVGGTMVAGAGVALIVKKRMKNED